MANSSKQKAPSARLGVTASGIAEAVAQDIELSIEQVTQASRKAVAAVEDKLGARKPPARTRKPAKKQQPQAKATTIKPRAAKAAKRSKGKKRK
jgi:hypothetical protein